MNLVSIIVMIASAGFVWGGLALCLHGIFKNK